MDFYQRIAANFQQTIELIAMSVDDLAQPIERCSQLISDTLLNDRKIIACGNGADGAVAQLFVSNLINHFEHDRPALPAISLGIDAASLTAIATSNPLEEIFSRQISALAQGGDFLLCISSDGGNANLAKAIQSAQDRNMTVGLLSNSDNKHLRDLLLPQDVEMRITAQRRPRVVELHTMIIHCLCEMIDLSLFGDYDQE
jgi:D-sedoheptulose 7-phosphate isomerase